MEEAKKELLRSKRYGHFVSVLMLDVDRFKMFNDEYGHQAGDEALKALVKTCKLRIRTTDIFGRYGGEEFLLILPETNQEAAYKLAEEIRINVADMEIKYLSKTMHITLSIGIVTTNLKSEDSSVDQLINYADKALYRAKDNGRNQTSSWSI